MSKEFEYYSAERAKDNTIPLLKPDGKNPKFVFRPEPAENPETPKFIFGDPVPKKPQMADYLYSPYSVISKKLYDVLSPMKIDTIQLVPAIITDDKKKKHDDYWFVHMFHKIECIDRKKSKCKIEDINISNVKKIILDQKVLTNIPLKERLIFRLKEDSSFQLFHKSIVDAIIAVQPTGIRFVPIEEWSDATAFKKSPNELP